MKLDRCGMCGYRVVPELLGSNTCTGWVGCDCYACFVMVIIVVFCLHDVDVETIDMLISLYIHMLC